MLTKGHELFKAIESQRLDVVSTGQPTYWPSDKAKTPDLIDFYITKGLSINYILCESSLELSSDHTPALITLSTEVVTKQWNCALHSADWPLFRELLKHSLSTEVKLKTEDDIEKAVEYFNSRIQCAAWESTLQSSIEPKLRFSKINLEKVKKKRHIRKKSQLSRCPQLKNSLNRAIKELKRLTDAERNSSVQEYL